VAATCKLGILSDIHYASAAEQARGGDFEYRDLPNPLLRRALWFHRHFLWARHPLFQNHLLDHFLEQAGGLDFVVANGDYSCDSIFQGVSDDAAFQSVAECLGKLRGQYGQNFRANLGDHELGKLSLVGRRGGMRLESLRRATQELGMPAFWCVDIGQYVLMGVASSLIGLPVFRQDTLPAELPEWERLRAAHLEEIRRAFDSLEPSRRVLLFCHDPTALPFLGREDAVRARLGQIEQTIIGHLHSNLVLLQSRCLSGMPPIRFLGHSALRLSSALREARHWRPFHVRLCPALAGVQLLKDGGFYIVEIDPEGRRPARFHFGRLKH
jgi:hypothetical protein